MKEKDKTTEELLKKYTIYNTTEGGEKEFVEVVKELIKKGVETKRETREVRYYNANGYAVAIVAVFTHPVDFAMYIGSTGTDLREMETVEWVSKWGCKLAETDARHYLPHIKLPYRG